MSACISWKEQQRHFVAYTGDLTLAIKSNCQWCYRSPSIRVSPCRILINKRAHRVLSSTSHLWWHYVAAVSFDYFSYTKFSIINSNGNIAKRSNLTDHISYIFWLHEMSSKWWSTLLQARIAAWRCCLKPEGGDRCFKFKQKNSTNRVPVIFSITFLLYQFTPFRCPANAKETFWNYFHKYNIFKKNGIN